MKLDAHQHFWDYAAHPDDYGWMGKAPSPLKRTFGPDHLAPLLAERGYDGTIAVQARERPEETDDLLALADRYSLIKGVVGWLNLCAPEVEDALDRYAAKPLLKGLRMLIHDHPDPDFAASDEHVRGVSLLEQHGLTYDLLLKPEHLAAATRLVDVLPRQKFVIDHMAKPRLDGRDRERWSIGITEIARRPNVWCKLSGAATFPCAVADWCERAADYTNIVIDTFGPDRCMIGSDWPVSTLNAEYRDVMGFVENCCARLSEAERVMVFGAACADFYGVDDRGAST